VFEVWLVVLKMAAVIKKHFKFRTPTVHFRKEHNLFNSLTKYYTVMRWDIIHISLFCYHNVLLYNVMLRLCLL